ncbi:MAG: hypothetical protein CME64_15290 [Halobacteriovoraceae bacterium]|nr:hypothetical protein [Halobacteriovoraceae bacterium]
MSFNYIEYLPLVVLGIAAFWLMTIKVEKKYYSWVLTHWFYKQSLASKLSSVFFFAGFSFLLLALLDLRGPEERVTGKSSDQKTVVLIDASASMLAEDVRPNRFEKATLLAKHFIKKAVGHQVSVVVFSDGQKRIVPFTKDMDLVEARLNTLKGLDLERGGTGLSMAIQESIQYFINSEQRPFGNILVITDAEETEGGLKLKVPDGISVAVVGVGTAKGGPIPIRNSRGVFRGNKKFRGETVISKLDESFLKQLGQEIKHFKYWVASSYSLPTEEILRFFRRSFKTKKTEDDFRVRPVLANYMMVPGVVFLIAAFMLKNLKSFVMVMLLIVSMNTFGQDKKEPEKNKVIVDLEERFARNELGVEGKKKLASELLKQGFSEEASKLYEEILHKDINNNNAIEKFNLGSAYLKSGKIQEGLKIYTDLIDHLESDASGKNQELLQKAKLNMLKAIHAQASQKNNKSQKNDKKQKKDEKGKDKKQKGQDGGQSKDQKESKDQGQQKDKKDKKDKDESKDPSDSNKNQDQKNKQKNDQAKDGKAKKDKVPSILKQLLSDDNQLQKKVIDANTVKGKSREKKDW